MNYFFGDKRTAFLKKQFYDVTSSQELCQQKPLREISQKLNFSTLMVVDQVHGTDGLVITDLQEALRYKPYSCAADFLVTNVFGVALGVATADCLPIIAHDPIKKVIGIAHAGWQGTVHGIAHKMVAAMHAKFNCAYADIKIIFGPCASAQEYEVSADFLKKVVLPFERELVLRQHEAKYYFDIVLCNRLLLEQCGIKNFNYEYVACTITNKRFCSHRREPGSLLRQLSVVVI